MGDNDFPAVMGNQPIGFVRQFMEKKGMYSQKGDNVPAFTNTMQVSQNQGDHWWHMVAMNLFS